MTHESTNEPVAWITNNGDGWLRWHRAADNNLNSIPLYTHPQDQKKDEALRLAQAFIRWTQFGECRTERHDGPIPTAAEVDVAIEQALENK